MRYMILTRPMGAIKNTGLATGVIAIPVGLTLLAVSLIGALPGLLTLVILLALQYWALYLSREKRIRSVVSPAETQIPTRAPAGATSSPFRVVDPEA